MAILHKNITNAADIHNPKWFSGANNGDYAFKNEKGELESIDELLLPAALNFVDASVAPPTSNSGDIYILSSGGSVNAGWGSVSLQDWVRYDGTQWNSITPQKSSLCYDKTSDSLKVFDGAAWAAIGGGDSIYTADGSLLANRNVGLGGNDLNFQTSGAGNVIILKDDGTLELGLGSNAGSRFETVLGNLANASGATAVAIGYNAQSTNGFTVAIGRNCNSTHNRSMIVGAQASSQGDNATSLGYGNTANTNGTAIGYDADAGTNAVSLGSIAVASGSNSIAIGNRATASGSESIMISTDLYAVTNSVANSLALSFDQTGHVFFAGLTANSYFNGSGNFGIGTTNPSGRLTVEGSNTLSTDSAFKLFDGDTIPNELWDFRNNGDLYVAGVQAFTGTGSYTNFTITNGVITSAS